ncbi:hypothetical protein NLX83_15295 [Allokutzneria sp. A3M-2-11 16]|uniref:hypothetical protein n=1 Tax=Allokutzneria sp. A3M-2-11 16 TaxID=2962043 RepID=UPI0020B8301B|nr:hypothetical protein [Allokutzneria sp. A3M-2-11 16]MCP3800631.1 hypothetical protein [Allokutzneria sp. A3M-2-11 16]
MKQLPMKERSGSQAWLGPISLGLAVASWVFPYVNLALVAAACVCGTVSIVTRKWHSIDWTAVAGITLALGQAVLALLVFATSLHP